MPITDQSKAAVLSSLTPGTWTLLSSNPQTVGEGWDTMKARWACDFKATAQTPLSVASAFPIGQPFSGGEFWLTGVEPERIGGNVWAANASYKGRFSAIHTGGATTSGSPTVTMTTTAGLAPGMTLIQANLPYGGTILSVDSSTQVTFSRNATATGTGLTFAGTRPIRVTLNGATDNQNADNIEVVDGYGDRTINHISVMESAPTMNIEYVLVNGVPPTTALGASGVSPAYFPGVRASFWSDLPDPVENWPSGWVLTGCPAELLMGTNIAPTPYGVWLVNEQWTYRYRFAP